MNTDDRAAALAQKILFAAFRIVLPSAAARISSIQDIVNAITDANASRWDRKDIARQLDASADKLAARLASFEEHEFRGLDEGDKAAAIHAVCDAVDALNITKQTVIDENADAEVIFTRIEQLARVEWSKAYVSPDGIEYGRVFLIQASRFIVNIVRDMPDFAKDVGITTLAVARRVLGLLEENIRLVVLPRYRAGTVAEISTFEADYRSDVIQKNKDVELFGMPIPVPELRRQPLDIAYITLSASPPVSPDILALSRTSPEASSTQEAYQASVDTAIAAVIRNSKSVAVDKSSGGAVVSSAEGVRILVSGPAGSGKTTLIQWLALRSAERSFVGDLAQWNNSIPFVLRLRNLFHGDIYEAPDEIALIELAVNRASTMPGDWIGKQLQDRQVVLLLDGLDELSEYHRPIANLWIERFIDRHPRVNVVITSRPEGLDYAWLNMNKFTSLALNSMSLHSIESCVNSWFEAVAVVAPDIQDELVAHRRKLLRDVHHRAAVRELAETPLVCAMLCAFYAYEISESAPDSRGDLYEQVIETLVDRRDRSRRAIERDRRGFTSNQKLVLLQAIARYLTEQQMLSISTYGWHTRQHPVTHDTVLGRRRSALSIVEEESAGIATLPITASEALDYLLKRSVIFREVAPGEAQFVHRSIQEFLTARSFAAAGRVDLLVEYLGTDQWDRIVAFAAGRLDTRSASFLLNAVLERTFLPGVGRRELLLLLAECLSTAKVDPELVQRASEALATILPPRSTREAEILGRSGEGVVRWLSRFRDEPEDVVVRCIQAAATSGSQAGLAVIIDFLPAAVTSKVKRALVDAWQYFDAEEYAETVLGRVQLGDIVVTINSADALQATYMIRGLEKVAIDVYSGVVDLSQWAVLPRLREVDCANFRSLTSLDGLGALSNLRRLNLSRHANITDFNELTKCTNLVDLLLDSCAGLSDGSSLRMLGSLRSLSLRSCTGIAQFDWLRHLPRLLTLNLNGCRVESISFLRELPAIQHLGLETLQGWHDLSDLEPCKRLRRLSLSLAPVRGTPLALPESLPLRALKLSGWVTVADLATLVKHRFLTDLTIIDIRDLADLRPFGTLKGLRKLSLNDCSDLHECAGIEDLEYLEELDLSGSAIRSLDIPISMTRLRRISLERCENLGDIEDLVELPNLEELILPPMDPMALAEMERRAETRKLRIICTPIVGGYETG